MGFNTKHQRSYELMYTAVKKEILLKLSNDSKQELYKIRNLKGVFVSEYLNYIWVKCHVENETFENKLFSIRFLEWFILKDNYLFKKDMLTPEMSFFKSEWITIDSYTNISLPTTSFGGKLEYLELDIQLIPHNEIENTVGVLTNQKSLEKYIIDAPNFRIESLEFVMSETLDVFIFGTPLLPIPGISYWKYKNFLLPNGFILHTKHHLDVLNNKMSEHEDALFLITEKKTIHTILKEHIKPLSRKAFVNNV